MSFDANEWMQDFIADRIGGSHLDFNQRFFTPTPAFYAALANYKDLRYVDCGTGRGDIPREMREHGFKCVGVDLHTRDGQRQDVAIMDARAFPFSRRNGVLICRPSHEGWCESVMRKALAAKATVFYVGLTRNLERDSVLDFTSGYQHVVYQDVGEENECMWVFSPA